MKRLYEKLHFVSELGCGIATGDCPLINVYKAGDGAIVEALIPGIESSDFKLTVKEQVLTIGKIAAPSAVHKNDKDFLRTIELPFFIDGAASSFYTCNGLLRIKLCRQETEVNSASSSDLEESPDCYEYEIKTGSEGYSSSPEVIPVLKTYFCTPQNKTKDCTFLPKTEIVESVFDYLMVVELPGIAKYDIKLTLDGSVLTIEGTKSQHLLQAIHLVYSEFETVSYHRRISLFNDMDQLGIVALLKNGTLRVRLPKKIDGGKIV